MMAFDGIVPLLLLGVFHTGLSQLIQTQHTVIAALGDDAHLSCQLTQPKNVVQVTWQKVLSKRRKDLATYSKHLGPRVNSPFEGKVEFQSAGLQNCSIVIRRVTEQDESCYYCLFNTYPEGAFTASTCLKVYEQYEPVLHITRSNSTEESLVSCSATGRPAPAVTLIVPSSQNNTVSVPNSNGTVTVTATAVLSGFHGNDTQVGCAVQHFSGAVMKVFKTIPKNNKASTAGVNNSAVTFAVIVALVIVAAVFCIWRNWNYCPSRSHKEPDNVKTPQTLTREPQEESEGETMLPTQPEEPQDRSHREPEGETMLPTLTEEPQGEPEEGMTPQTPTQEDRSPKEPEGETTLKSPTQEPQEGMNMKEQIRQGSTPWNENGKAIKNPIRRKLFMKE